ncbi:MAG: hypothetical protein JWP56_3147 [Aeromicrobium sp.]|nr:hypothetical protein [Aeromicrobium sp.]
MTKTLTHALAELRDAVTAAEAALASISQVEADPTHTEKEPHL